MEVRGIDDEVTLRNQEQLVAGNIEKIENQCKYESVSDDIGAPRENQEQI